MEKYLLRFVPTMKCNFNCDYCFLGKSSERSSETMFDYHSVAEWIEAMKQYSDKKIEIYMWGGEPFLLDDTYTLLKAWLAMDHITGGCRIDTNLYFADKIAERCPSNKLKLNCSYHMQHHTLDEEFAKVKKLKSLDMVGMVNFVASESNLRKLHDEYHMSVHDLIEKFAEIGVFMNVAGDFALANDKKYVRRDEYMSFILQFISPQEWELLRGDNKKCKCDAGKYFFTVNNDGRLTSCIDNAVYGDFFKGEIKPAKHAKKCKKECQSLISYPWRQNNECIPWNSLLEYVKRNEEYRKSVKEKTDFVFD